MGCGRGAAPRPGLPQWPQPERSHDTARQPRRDLARDAARGLYLAAYYLGGLAGAALLGQVFGWPATVAVIAVAALAAALLAARLKTG